MLKEFRFIIIRELNLYDTNRSLAFNLNLDEQISQKFSWVQSPSPALGEGSG